MADIKFDIREHLGTLSISDKGWSKELNIVSWNGREAKLDIREWAPDHDRMGKGVTLSIIEAEELEKALRDHGYRKE